MALQWHVLFPCGHRFTKGGHGLMKQKAIVIFCLYAIVLIVIAIAFQSMASSKEYISKDSITIEIIPLFEQEGITRESISVQMIPCFSTEAQSDDSIPTGFYTGN